MLQKWARALVETKELWTSAESNRLWAEATAGLGEGGARESGLVRGLEQPRRRLKPGTSVWVGGQVRAKAVDLRNRANGEGVAAGRALVGGKGAFFDET